MLEEESPAPPFVFPKSKTRIRSINKTIAFSDLKRTKVDNNKLSPNISKNNSLAKKMAIKQAN